MYISSRAALVRNLSVALLNGTVTLIILLIAPLGLAAVIINTILVTIASFVNATAGDAIINFLQPSQIKTLLAQVIEQQSQLTKKNKNTK
ncbi:CRISPR-associated protein Csx18 [Fortiea contorta]|uniref:CRISPR-associated protein Csx18 n=1 Tax=Fortiea contorta TaxID=1892405 RepID=UPI00034716A7|nr:CRISPR-associated protein Csx18 [Fortiea contorta]